MIRIKQEHPEVIRVKSEPGTTSIHVKSEPFDPTVRVKTEPRTITQPALKREPPFWSHAVAGPSSQPAVESSRRSRRDMGQSTRTPTRPASRVVAITTHTTARASAMTVTAARALLANPPSHLQDPSVAPPVAQLSRPAATVPRVAEPNGSVPRRRSSSAARLARDTGNTDALTASRRKKKTNKKKKKQPPKAKAQTKETRQETAKAEDSTPKTTTQPAKAVKQEKKPKTAKRIKAIKQAAVRVVYMVSC